MALPEPAPVLAPLAAPLTTTHRVISYTYDSLYRLITATYSTGEYYQYAYDPVGNRLSLTTTVNVVNYQYDDANRLTGVNGQAYTWDNNGNLLSDGVRSYTYTHANRLTQVVSGTLTTGFAYPSTLLRAGNGAGDRVARTADGVTTDYVLDPAAGLTQVLQETTGGQTTNYLYGADLLAQYDSGTWAYHLNDGLGSVRQLADPAGQVVASYSFSPFGVPLGESGGEPYGFTGEQWDAEVELLYLRARYYVPETGVFLSRDPVEGEPPYLYVRGNPVNRVDPSGLTPVPWGVGTQYMYSCKCGWIDWGGHGSPKTGLIKRLRNATDTAETNFVWLDDVMNIPGSRIVIWKPAAQPDTNLFRVALGIYISASNIFEEVIQGSSWNPLHAQSLFSNEDLISNLIGFHRGVHNYFSGAKGDDEDSRKYYMDLCDVVGYEYYKAGDFDEFIQIQKNIWGDMFWKGQIPLPTVRRQTIWGVRPSNQWSGSVETKDCQSVGCSGSDCLPVQLIAITPNPPLDGWAWSSTSISYKPLTFPLSKASIRDFGDSNYLNSRPLNWGPSGS